MKQRLSSPQTILIWLAFAIGALLRFSALGAAPLTDGEAELALQALQVAQGKAIAIQAFPLEIFTSAGLFFLFGSSNFFARSLAALSGTLFILGAVSLRQRLGENFSLVLAFALALDPALIAQSRQMGSLMPALAALGAVYLFASQARWRLVGIALGLGILSGPSFWYGGLLSLCVVIAFVVIEKQLAAHDSSVSLWAQIFPPKEKVGHFLSAFLLTVIVTSTLFFFYPRGLGAIFSPLVVFLSEWEGPASASIPHLLLALGIYQPLAILFAVISIGRSLFSREVNLPLDRRSQRFLGLWFVIATLLAIINPARQIAHLIWMLLPLWIFAAQEITHWIEELEQPIWALSILGATTLIMLSLFWLQLAAYTSLLPYGGADWLRFATVFSSLVLIALIVWLAEMVWSARLAWQGMILGVLLAFILYNISTVWGVAFSYPSSQVFRQELWKPYPQIGDADLLLKTVEDLSRWKSGRADSVPVVLAVDSPALQWLLRDQTQLTILPEDQAFSQLSVWQTGQLPDLLITPATAENPALAATYRGQDFNWRYRPNWQGIPLSPLNWLLFRQGTWDVEPIILWARADLFPDSQSLAGSQTEQPLEIQSDEEFPFEQP